MWSRMRDDVMCYYGRLPMGQGCMRGPSWSNQSGSAWEFASQARTESVMLPEAQNLFLKHARRLWR